MKNQQLVWRRVPNKKIPCREKKTKESSFFVSVFFLKKGDKLRGTGVALPGFEITLPY